MSCAMELLESRRLLSTYYVSAQTGSDANSGRSSRLAWQTLSAVNAHTFRRGNQILLTGSFSDQTLVLGSNASGVTVNSYTFNPKSRATKVGVPNSAVLSDLSGDGIDITASGVTIQNLVLIASLTEAISSVYSYGIYLHNQTSVAMTRETINKVTVSGFSYAGLCMQGWNTTTSDSAGFSNVLIENSSFSANQVSGIFVGTGDTTGNEFLGDFPANFYANSNLTIKNCQALNNAGFNAALTATPDGTHINNGNFASGGIFISSVNGATVQNCTAFNNCFNANGSVGIWAFDSNRVNFQADESYDNKTAGQRDGDGFDFDHGVTSSIMQRDYSHGNASIGFFLATYGGTSNDNGNTIRFCVSDDDGGAGIALLSTMDVPILGANIYNNTILAGGASRSTAIALLGEATASDSVNIFDNLFYADSTDELVTVVAPSPGVRFIGNDYWIASAPGTVTIEWGDTTYSSLASWSAAGGGDSAGQVQDPDLVSEVVRDLPASTVKNLRLSKTSPLGREGVNLSTKPYAAEIGVGGIGKLNFLNRPINRRAIGAG